MYCYNVLFVMIFFFAINVKYTRAVSRLYKRSFIKKKKNK